MRFPNAQKSTLLAALLTLSAHAFAATPVTLVGSDLEPRRVNLQGLDDDSLSYFDADRQYRTQPVARVLQLRDLGTPDQAAANRGVIETADGQRIFGTLDPARTTADKIAWSNPTLGTLQINVDDLRTLAIKPIAAPARDADKPATRDDLIILANGDSLAGFLAGASGEGIEVKPTGANEAIKLPWDRLRGFMLFNAVPRKQPPAHRLHFADGSRLHATHLSVAGDQITFTPVFSPLAADGAADKKASRTLPLSKVIRVDLHAISDPSQGTLRLIELADLPMKTVAGGEVFGVPLAPFSDDQGLHFHAPVKVAFTLPAGAKRIAAVAELDLSPEPARPVTPPRQPAVNPPAARRAGGLNPAAGVRVAPEVARRNVAPAQPAPAVPADKNADADQAAEKNPPLTSDAGASLALRGDRETDARWTDFEVIATLNQKQVGRFRINQNTQKIRINYPLDSADPAQPAVLELELVPGVNGPIMDRLRLSDTSILVAP